AIHHYRSCSPRVHADIHVCIRGRCGPVDASCIDRKRAVAPRILANPIPVPGAALDQASAVYRHRASAAQTNAQIRNLAACITQEFTTISNRDGADAGRVPTNENVSFARWLVLLPIGAILDFERSFAIECDDQFTIALDHLAAVLDADQSL